MERSNANENAREEIEIEPFQNENLMDHIPITKNFNEKFEFGN
jgi:hypothetical protein